ncbi:MAG: hypothetical protein HC882_09455 [Acidobacteria bacterium]|nr:hypothetical protein [Acidobacteriota bacterium]
MRRPARGSDENFYCWKYQLWYSLRDCVFRHGWKTTEVCASCEQGASNMKLTGPPPPPPKWVRLPTPPSRAEGAEGDSR